MKSREIAINRAEDIVINKEIDYLSNLFTELEYFEDKLGQSEQKDRDGRLCTCGQCLSQTRRLNEIIYQIERSISIEICRLNPEISDIRETQEIIRLDIDIERDS